MYSPRLTRILVCGLISSCFAAVPVKAQDSNAPRQALPTPYQRWLDEDSRYLITDQERSDFEKLTTNEQRDKFIANFWESRNPNPGSGENTFKKEHYRRLAYANQRFAAKAAGYITDRGHIYILYGPPDERESHPASTQPNLPPDACPTVRYRSDIWRYNFIPGLGRNVFFDFVDKCDCGEFQLIHDPTKRRPRPTDGPQTSIAKTLLPQH